MKDIEISRPRKVLFPDDGITKSGLARYHRAVARRAVPRLRGRPLMMERHPDGIGGTPVMQKNAPAYFPDWVHTARLPKEGGTVRPSVRGSVVPPVRPPARPSVRQPR